MDVSASYWSYLFRGDIYNIYEVGNADSFLDSTIFLLGIHCPEICSCAKIYVYKNYFSIICNRGKLLEFPVVRTPHSHFQEPGSVPGQGTTHPKSHVALPKKRGKLF